MFNDLRYAFRWLRRSPGFAIVATLSLGLGVGVNTAMFSLVDGLLFRPLPVESPGRLVDVFTSSGDGDEYATSSYPDFQDMKAQNTVFSNMIGYSPMLAPLALGERSRIAFGQIVTSNYFGVLGIQPDLGRLLVPAHLSARPDPSDRVAYGRYLVRTAGCAECHATRDDAGQPQPGLQFAGGMEFRFPAGGVVRAPNISPDADTGIGTWSEEQFVNRFKIWERAADRVLPASQRGVNTVMPWKQLGGMTRADLGAVYAYLRSTKPVIHLVRKRDPIQR